MKTNKAFENFLLKHGVVGFKEEGFTLKSGKTSYWYANFRNLSKTNQSLGKTADFVVKFLLEKKLITKNIDAVIGVPEGATLLGNRVSEVLIKKGLITDMLYSLRVKEKDHGDSANRFWTNGNIPRRVVVLEDVTTTGGSVLELVDKLRKRGIVVRAVVGLLNRQQLDKGKSVVEKMRKKKIRYVSLTDASLVLPLAIKKFPARKRDDLSRKIQNEYLKEYKVGKKVPINL